MATVTASLMRFFRGSSPGGETTATRSSLPLTRRSSGLNEVFRQLRKDDALCVLDIGAASPRNIRFMTELGHKIYSEDLLTASTDPALTVKDEHGTPMLDSKRFLADNLVYDPALFDLVLCWNLSDYLEEALVKPVVGRLWSTLKPGGLLLAFFHTKEAGPDSPCYRYHIASNDTVEMQLLETRKEVRRGPTGAVHTAVGGHRLQRVFNNRHIENLFRDFASIKFFLSRDNIREVLVVR